MNGALPAASVLEQELLLWQRLEQKMDSVKSMRLSIQICWRTSILFLKIAILSRRKHKELLRIK